MKDDTEMTSEPILLNKADLSIEAVIKVANGTQIEVSDCAMERVKDAYQIMLNAAMAGHSIYGLTVGVGLNKDRKMLDASGEMSDAVIATSLNYNLGLLRSHAGGLGPDSDLRIVRAAMAIRLNTILTGGPGVSPPVAEMFVAFLNRDISPVIPSQGSVGIGDPILMSHIGLAMIGDGDVYYKGERLPAREALACEKLEPLKPFAKDGLAILSNNAFSAGKAVLLFAQARQLCKVSQLVYAASLEGLNGNVSPILPDVVAQRSFPGLLETSQDLIDILEGSYLWNEDPKRPLQDPLSFRNGPHLISAMRANLDRLEALLELQINSSDDNPTVIIGASTDSDLFEVNRSYVEGGAVLRTGNFIPIHWVTALEELAILVAHVASASAQRVAKLIDPYFTDLPRYLGNDTTRHSLVAMEVPVLALASEIRSMAMPSSFDYLPLARGVEDIGTNSSMLTSKVQSQIESSFIVLGIELFHAAQAIDLRRKDDGGLNLGRHSKPLLDNFRKVVPFLDEDKSMAPDFSIASSFLRSLEI